MLLRTLAVVGRLWSCGINRGGAGEPLGAMVASSQCYVNTRHPPRAPAGQTGTLPMGMIQDGMNPDATSFSGAHPGEMLFLVQTHVVSVEMQI